MAIDFGAFTAGSRAAKKDYWDDIKNSQGALIRDVAVQDGLQMLKDSQDKEWAASYVSPMLLDQQRAAADGVPADQWYQRAMTSILNDEGFKNATSQQQQRVMEHVRLNGITMADKLVKAGDPQRALELKKSMGQNFGPDNVADPTQVFNANGLVELGFKTDPKTGVWESSTGQKVDGYKAASALAQYGQQGLLNLLAVQADEQRKMAQGVQQGTYVEQVDAKGNATYRPKTDIEFKLDADKQNESFMEYKLQEAVKTNPNILTNPEMARLFAQGSDNPPAMMNTIIRVSGAKPQGAAGVDQGAQPVGSAGAAIRTPITQAAPQGVPAMAAQIQQATGVQTPPETFGLDVHGLPDANTPPAMRPFQQAIAAQQANSAVDESRTEIQTWLSNLKTAPTAEDRAWVNQLLTINPALMQDEQLMSSLMEAFPQ